jgi:hypothetical protein
MRTLNWSLTDTLKSTGLPELLSFEPSWGSLALALLRSPELRNPDATWIPLKHVVPLNHVTSFPRVIGDHDIAISFVASLLHLEIPNVETPNLQIRATCLYVDR